MKKVFLYITEYDISIDNGPGINEREFVNALLSEHKNEVICIIPYPKHPKNYQNSKIEYVRNHNGFKKLYYFKYLKDTVLKIHRLKKKYHIKAVVTRLSFTPIVPLIALYLYRIPVILKTLARYSTYSERANWKGKLLNSLLLPFYKLIIQKSVLSDTVSGSYLDWLEYKFGVNRNKTIIIPNGVNAKKFTSGSREEAKKKLKLDQYDHIIGYIGALTKARYIEEIIRAFVRLRNRNNTLLLFVGDGQKRKKLESIVKDENLDDNVIFTGHVPYQMVPVYMKAFDVSIDLTLMKMSLGEVTIGASYSQKIPQYLACGLPVVVWDVPDNQFIKNEKIGEIVKFGDIDGLANSIDNLIHMDNKIKTEIHNKAEKYAIENLSIEQLTKKRIMSWNQAIGY